MNQLEQLKHCSVVVADTGDFLQLARYQPRDATTNPSLILKAVRQADYAPLLAQTVAEHPQCAVDEITDRVLVRFGTEILRIVPGRVSTEVDARLSFDTTATLARARRIVGLYEAQGVSRDRLLIKLASTWEGFRAAETLQMDGINCNMTLIFSLAQAAACADAGASLISPFVGRIYDWYKKTAGSLWDEEAHAGANDPGVRSVVQIWQYYKQHGIRTEVMGASFRNTGQILALAGCDLLTISPDLLERLSSSSAPVCRVLDRDDSVPNMPRLNLDEASFRAALDDDAMASEKLAEGIQQFEADAIALEHMVGEVKSASR